MSVYVAYTLGRYVEYKNALMMESKYLHNTDKLNGYLLEHLKNSDIEKTMQVLEDSKEVNQTILEQNKQEAKELSFSYFLLSL
jgi:hypothetical protein